LLLGVRRVGLSLVTGSYCGIRSVNSHPPGLIPLRFRSSRQIHHYSPWTYLTRIVTTSSVPQQMNSGLPLNISQIDHNNPHEWQPVYRFTSMPFLQAISRLKFLFTTMLVLGTPFVVYAGYEGYVTPNFPVFFVGATVFSLGTLATFSYFSTKLIGVVSIHKPSGLIRLGHLTFWGGRANTLVPIEHLVPPTDFADNPTDSQTVRIGVLTESISDRPPAKIQRIFFMTRLRSNLVDGDAFERLFGFRW
ncbi:Transmembrane protein, partial [Fasciolopsis buskii]